MKPSNQRTARRIAVLLFDRIDGKQRHEAIPIITKTIETIIRATVEEVIANLTKSYLRESARQPQ